jgi:hypothetical protein
MESRWFFNQEELPPSPQISAPSYAFAIPNILIKFVGLAWNEAIACSFNACPINRGRRVRNSAANESYTTQLTLGVLSKGHGLFVKCTITIQRLEPSYFAQTANQIRS